MKNRATFLLTALFFGGLALLSVLQWKGRDAGTVVGERLLTGFFDAPDATVKAIEISGETRKEPLRFERRGDDWQIVRPIDALADRSKLNALVETLRSLAPRSDSGTVPGPAREYRLDPPEHVITLFPVEASRGPVTVKLGEVRRDFVYIQVDDDPSTLVVDSSGLSDLSNHAADWRSRVLFPTPSHEVEQVAFETGRRAFALKHGIGTWKIIEPFHAPAEDPKVEGLIDTLLGLRVASESGFIADDVSDLTPFGLDHPHLRISITSGRKSSTTRSVILGNPIPNRPGFVYAILDGQNDVLAVDGSIIPPFASLSRSLRNTEVADVDFDRASELRVRCGPLDFVLTRDGNRWTQSSPVAGMGDSRLILDYLALLGGMHALEIVPEGDAADTGLEQPSAIIQVWHDLPRKEAPDVTLRLGRFDAERQVLYAQVEGEPNVLTLPASARRLILTDRLALADRTIQNFPPGSIRRVAIEQSGKSVTLQAADQGRDYEHWSMIEPIKAPVDVPSVSALDAVLSRLRAENLCPEASPAVTGFDQPWLRAEWVFTDQSRGTLSVGSLVPEGHGARFAASSTSDAPFTLSESSLLILSAEMHDRTVLRIPETTINTITVRHAGTSRRWRREAKVFQQSEWVSVSGTDPGEAVAPLVRALADLQTSRYLQYQGPLLSRFGLTDNPLVIEIQESSGAKPTRLRVGSIAEKGQFAATTSAEQSGAVFLLPASLIRPLLPERKLPVNVFKTD